MASASCSMPRREALMMRSEASVTGPSVAARHTVIINFIVMSSSSTLMIRRLPVRNLYRSNRWGQRYAN